MQLSRTSIWPACASLHSLAAQPLTQTGMTGQSRGFGQSVAAPGRRGVWEIAIRPMPYTVGEGRGDGYQPSLVLVVEDSGLVRAMQPALATARRAAQAGCHALAGSGVCDVVRDLGCRRLRRGQLKALSRAPSTRTAICRAGWTLCCNGSMPAEARTSMTTTANCCTRRSKRWPVSSLHRCSRGTQRRGLRV